MTHDDAEADASCLPFCEKCVAGACVAPNKCQCDPGYHGDDCALGKSGIKSAIIEQCFFVSLHEISHSRFANVFLIDARHPPFKPIFFYIFT